MRVLGFLTLVACLTLAHSAKKYYIYKIYKLNWYAAFQDCLSRDLQLATITSDEEQRSLDIVIKRVDAVNDMLWTSGTDQGEKGNFFWMSTGRHFNYTKWSSSQPDNFGGIENCVHTWNIDGVTQWNNRGCDNRLYYICEDKPKTKCVFNLKDLFTA